MRARVRVGGLRHNAHPGDSRARVCARGVGRGTTPIRGTRARVCARGVGRGTTPIRGTRARVYARESSPTRSPNPLDRRFVTRVWIPSP